MRAAYSSFWYTYEVVGTVSWNPSIPSSLHWCTLKNGCQCESESSGCHDSSSQNDQALEVFLVHDIGVLVYEHFQVEGAERKLGKASQKFVADLVEIEVKHSSREGRWYGCSVFTKA